MRIEVEIVFKSDAIPIKTYICDSINTNSELRVLVLISGTTQDDMVTKVINLDEVILYTSKKAKQ